MLLETVRAIVIFGFVATVTNTQTTSGDETEITSNELTAYVQKKGASIRFYRSLGSAGKTGQVTVKFWEMREVDADGKGVTGPGKHSFNNFNNQDFNVSGQRDVVLPNAVGVMATVVTLETYLPDVGTQLKFQVYVIKTGGNLTLGDEMSTVSEGQLKFAVEVHRWGWALSGAFLELDVNIQVPPGREVREESGASTEKKQPKKFSFGGGAAANFSTKVQVDGAWQDMTSGYPKFTMNGANNIITVRLPRFNNSVLYDPTFDAGTESDGTSKGSFIFQSSFTLGILCGLVLMLRWAP